MSTAPDHIHTSNRDGPTAILAMLALGIGVGVAVLGMMDGTLSRPDGCVDPVVCNAGAVGDFLARWTPERQLPEEALWAGFRSLTAVGLALTLLLLGVLALNLSTLIVARSTSLRGEFALRSALGATPLALARRVGRTALSLSLRALVIGAGMGMAGGLALQASWPLGPAPWEPLVSPVRAPTVAAVALVAVVALSLLWPVGIAWSRDLRRHLATGARATTGPVEAVARDALAVIQVAASLVVLVSAGLLIAAFAFSPDPADAAADGGVRALVAKVHLPGKAGAVGAPAERARQYEQIIERVRLLPGVVDSSVATDGSWLGIGMTDRVTALCAECGTGLLPKQQTSGRARIHSVSAGFFEALAVAQLRGRSIEQDDDASGPAVAVISNAFAVTFFPNGDPLGKEVRLGGLEGEWVRVVGIVDDVRAPGLGSGSLPVPAMYLSILQHPPSEAGLIVRTSGDVDGVPAAVEGAAASAVPGVRMATPVPLERLLDRHRAPLRWFAMLFSVLATLVMLVATGGLYVLISYNVRRRTREIGVRMAVGAGERDVLRMVVGQTMRRVALGVVVGLIPLSGLARLLQLRFQGVDPWDPALALSTALLLSATALAASYRPAQRASRVEPQVALREA